MRVSIHTPSYPTPHTCLVWKWWKNSPWGSLYYIPTYPHTPHHIPVWCGSGGRTPPGGLCTTYPHTLIPHTTYLFGVEVVEELPMRVSIHTPSYPTPHTCLVWKWWKNSPWGSLYYIPTYPHTPHHIPVWCGSGGRTPPGGLCTTYPHTLIPHTTYLFGVEVVEELPMRVSIHTPSYPTPHTCLVWKWWKNSP